uniref:Uncharacterized protein n=1 Tax=Globisporangium ultimum (strain ATCC 200006 / CBS 805.95 / DAOM BR144) TaxID=431595 RepID=K3WQ77_GLOUD
MNLSGNFDTEHSDIGAASSVLAFEDDEEVVNASQRLSSSPEFGKSDSIDSYGTEPRDADFNDTFMTVKSSASSVSDEGTGTGRMDTMAVAYLRSAGENESNLESDLGDDDDFDESSSYSRGGGDSFLSAMSTRSDDDASFYIDGQRRNIGESIGAVDNGEKRQSPMKKL